MLGKRGETVPGFYGTVDGLISEARSSCVEQVVLGNVEQDGADEITGRYGK